MRGRVSTIPSPDRLRVGWGQGGFVYFAAEPCANERRFYKAVACCVGVE